MKLSGHDKPEVVAVADELTSEENTEPHVREISCLGDRIEGGS